MKSYGDAVAEINANSITASAVAAQLIPEGAQESLDTLTEIAQWIQDLSLIHIL